MKFFGHLFLFFLCAFSAAGQNNSISGTILDKVDNQAIISGSISLLGARDSSYIVGVISNSEGFFSFRNVRPGNYILKITYLGYHPLMQNITVRENQSSLNLGKLYLEADAILLSETVVEGKKPEIIIRNDTIEYDASSFKVPENSALEELIKRLPGMEVDKDGKITAQGREVKRITVDGKEFFSDDPQVASRNLPADMVDRLQVLDRRSERSQMTGFDDGEEETVINLTIRPGMKQGTMGNVLAGAGKDVQNDNDLRYQAGAFINHMKNSNRYTLIAGRNNNNNMGAGDLGVNQFGRMRGGGGSGGITESTNLMFGINREFSPKATLNGDLRYNAFDRNTEQKISQSILSKGESQLEKTLTNSNSFSENISANLRFEWKPDTLNTLIFRPNIRYNRSNNYTFQLDTVVNAYDFPILYTNSHSINQRIAYNFGGSLNYSHRFANKRGRVLNIDARGSFSNNNSWGNNYTVYVPNEDLTDLYQRSENNNLSNNWRITTSFVEPIGRNNFIQALYRIEYSDAKNINSTYDLWEVDPLLALSIASDSAAILIPGLSRSIVRNSTEQRFGLSFKAERAKYNYTIGLNVDPTRSSNETYRPLQSDTIDYWFAKRLPNLQGTVLVPEPIRRNVINYSPVFNFRYRFDQRSNLQINIEGETNQPSANQLRGDTIQNSTNWTLGNPDLKPGYSNNVRIRFQKYIPKTQFTYNFNLSGDMSFNDITPITRFLKDSEGNNTAIRLTEYENINGNWNSRVSGMFNTPLRNKRFTVGAMAGVTYRNLNTKTDGLKNTMRNLSIFDNFTANYRSDLFDIGVNFSINHSNISYTVNPDNNQKTYNYRLGSNTAWYLPYNWQIQSDISWTVRQGYSTGFNVPETIWNAAVTKQVFNKKYGTGSLKLQIFDILQDRKMIFASSTTSGFQTSEDLIVLPSYFMCSFVYKFSAFPKASSATEQDVRPQWHRPDGPVIIRQGDGQQGGGRREIIHMN